MVRKLALSLALVLAGAAFTPLASSAQAYPPPPPQGAYPPPPGEGPYRPSDGDDIQGNYLRGTVAYFRPYFLILDTGGRRIAVHLHVGTVILPTGLTLEPGMYIGINGYWVRGYYYRGAASFVADQIVLLR